MWLGSEFVCVNDEGVLVEFFVDGEFFFVDSVF